MSLALLSFPSADVPVVSGADNQLDLFVQMPHVPARKGWPRGKSQSRRSLQILLLKKIHALTAQKGYCYAGNAYFIEEQGSPFFGFSTKTISRYISDLASEKFVSVQRGRQRRIHLEESGLSLLDSMGHKSPVPSQIVPTTGQEKPTYRSNTYPKQSLKLKPVLRAGSREHISDSKVAEMIRMNAPIPSPDFYWRNRFDTWGGAIIQTVIRGKTWSKAVSFYGMKDVA